MSMYAIVKKEAAPGLSLEQVPIPEIGPLDVLIKINKTAICGTDIHIYQWDRWSQEHLTPPVIVGHEYAGEIMAMGELVTGLQVGDRVTGEGHITCGVCRNCRAGTRHLCKDTHGVGVERNGAFAEYLALPAVNVVKLPDDVPDEIAALFDPFGNATHTALKFNLVGEDVLITGAGPIGMMAAKVARHAGARHIVITDFNPTRLELAKQLEPTVNTVQLPDETLGDMVSKLGMLEGFDVGLEMSGSGAALASMIDNMKHGAHIALLGTHANPDVTDWNKVIFGGLEIMGIYGREMFETWYKMISMVQSGLDLSPIITHRFDFRDFEAGFEAMSSGHCGKVILDWTTANKK